MSHPRIVFRTQLEAGLALCLLPLGRVLVEAPTQLSQTLMLYPPDFFTPQDLRVVSYPAHEFREIERRGYGDSLPWGQSAASMVELDDFLRSALLALPIELDWSTFYQPETHTVHLEMISAAAARAETVLDRVRFDYCRMDLPDTLPGPAGYLAQEGFSAGLFYSLKDHESYVIAGQVITHTVVIGLGLDMDSVGPVDGPDGGEVGNLARHGLRLYSAALAAPDDTAKFKQLMVLLEFLSDPDRFQVMQKAKKPIARHVAKDRDEYDAIIADFRVLTSDDSTPNQGLRHNIVHLGKRLEDLLDPAGRKAVLRRLDRYAGVTLRDFIERGDADWQAILDYRQARGLALGLLADD
jgi:hypothetical protein